MAFIQVKLTKSFNQSRGIFDKYVYQPGNSDSISDILGSGYFDDSRYIDDPDWLGSVMEISATNGYAIARVVTGGLTVLYDSTGGGSVNVEWGGITGDINSQADLADVAKTNDYDDLTNIPALSPTGSMFYVHKNGSDSDTGLTTELPLQTIGEAIAKAILLTPAAANQMTIEVMDSGTYFETYELPEWVHINAINAANNGRITISDNCIIRFRRLQNSTDTQPIVRKTDGTGFARITCDLMIVAGTTQEGMLVNMGLAHLDAGVLDIDAGVGIKAKNGARVSFIVPEILMKNGALGLGTRTAGGDPNFSSGSVSYAVDTTGDCVLVESRVTGDVLNLQAGSLLANTLYDMGAGTTLNVFANEAIGAIIADPTATVNSTISGVSNFNSTTDIVIDRVLEAVSLADDQEPTGLGIANALQIEFGAAQFTGSDPVMIDVDGMVTFNVSGMYRVKSVFQFGRTGQSGTSELLFRLLVNGVQLGRSVGVKLGNSDVLQYIDIDNWFNVPAGTTLTTEIMRDNSGHDSGGIFKTSPTDEGAGTWGDVPCTVLRIERWASP